MLQAGKHRGRSFADVSIADRCYCCWVLREKNLGRALTHFRKYLVEVHGGIMVIGKHKGKFFNEVLDLDPDYCSWVMTLQTNPGAFAKFIDYIKIREHMKEDYDAAPPEQHRSPSMASDVCKICFEHNINTCLVPCGHMAPHEI